jgi:hypothetical protein
MSVARSEPPRRPAAVTRAHGVHRFLGRLHEVFDAVQTDTLWAMSPVELAQCLEEAYAAQARLTALTLALVAQGDRSDLAAHDGMVDLVGWLRERARLAPAEAKRQVRLARSLEDYPVTREALASGRIPVASAAVVVAALDALPAEVDATVQHRAEEYLAGEARAHDTQALRRLGQHLDEVIDPDGADARLAEQLARAEAKAARRVFLHLHHDEVNATTDGVFRIPLLQGVKLQRMLETLLNPGRPDPLPSEDPATGVRYSPEEHRGHALSELIDRIPQGRLPKTGGCDPVVVVTMELRTLLGDLAAAHLDTGQAISPGAVRRLAAQCGVIPAVLGTSGEVLDLGRKARLYNRKQRLAMTVQQGGACAVEGCDRPASWGEAHHLTPWRSGGCTDLRDGVMICRRHHAYADHPDYTVERLRPGRIRLTRRQ